MTPALAPRPLLVALVLLVLAGGVGAAPLSQDLAGRYVLEGTARVHAPPMLDREIEAGADASLAPVPGTSDVRVRLTWGRSACELIARRAGSALAFATGQRCDVVLDEPEVGGKVIARLRSGSGRVEGAVLSLETAWDLSGAVNLRIAGGVRVLGKDVPGASFPPTHVAGTAEVSVKGERLAPGG
jgi:hypothetical protein